MRLVAENRIPDITEMRHLHAIEQEAILELAGISQDATASDDDIAPHKRAWADLGARSDPRGSDQRGARGQLHRRIDEDIAFHVNPRGRSLRFDFPCVARVTATPIAPSQFQGGTSDGKSVAKADSESGRSKNAEACMEETPSKSKSPRRTSGFFSHQDGNPRRRLQTSQRSRWEATKSSSTSQG